MNKTELILKRMEAASFYYQNDILSYNIIGDPYTSLVKFLTNYAHERNVSVKKYPTLAKKTLEKLYDKKLTKIEENHPKEAWEIYKKIAHDDELTKIEANHPKKAWDKYKQKAHEKVKLNKTHNPMYCHKGILNIMHKNGILNLSNYLISLIKERKTKDAHKILTDIRGVGNKIASFYLRDIVFLSRLENNEITDRYLLQPIDIWVNRGLSLLEEDMPKDRVCKQKKIVELCNKYGVSDIGFNQGCWMIGGVIAYDENHFTELIKNGTSDRVNYLGEYIKKLNRTGLD